MFEQTFKNIDDILHKDAGCSSELDYVEQTSWVLFLKYLDDFEKTRKPLPSFQEKDMPKLSTRNIAGQNGLCTKEKMASSTTTKP
jgi:hypothetical protein